MLLLEPPKLLIGPLVEEERDLQRRLRHREEQKRWRLRNPEKSKLASRLWREMHPEKVREEHRLRRSANPEKVRERRKRWWMANPGKRREERKRWRRAHPEKYHEAQRRYRKKHREELNAYSRLYYARRQSMRVVAQSPDEILKRVYACLPAGAPRFIRDDVAGEMLLAVLEGKLLVENIARSVGEFTKKYNRQFDTFKTISLDAPIAGTDLRRIDLLIAE